MDKLNCENCVHFEVCKEWYSQSLPVIMNEEAMFDILMHNGRNCEYYIPRKDKIISMKDQEIIEKTIIEHDFDSNDAAKVVNISARLADLYYNPVELLVRKLSELTEDEIKRRNKEIKEIERGIYGDG